MTEDRSAEASERLIVALDFPSARAALDCVDRLEGSCRWVKVGLELYCAAGNSLVEMLSARGMKVFLDLKFHDIPNTVAGAIRSVANTGASMITLHAGGGQAMMHAAVRAADDIPDSPKLLAVTMLTSMDAHQMAGVGLDKPPAVQVLRLAELATACGLSGLVCSAEETSLLRERLAVRLTLVVPGIRPANAGPDDQRRTSTPSKAIREGASMLVVGRPITQSFDPGQAARAILAEISSSLPGCGSHQHVRA